jgi:uncharacterized protein YqjF (DUF2071 family)
MTPSTAQTDRRGGPECDTPVDRPVMLNRWESLTFLHWRYRPQVVQHLLPPGLTVDTIGGSAWVALVPFVLRWRLPGLPELPWAGGFAETNVRTYVRGADGSAGAYFFSLDASRLGAVAVARSSYRLPYFWARMDVDREGSRISYTSRRRWPGQRGASSRVEIEIGRRYETEELGALDHFLTARWALFTAPSSGLRHARVSHDPWALHHARVLRLDDELIAAAGLPTPEGQPLVHYSPAVEVRIGRPGRAGGVDLAPGRSSTT